MDDSATTELLRMSHRIEYRTLTGELIRSQAINMTPADFERYAREYLTREAERISKPYDPNLPRIVEALHLIDHDDRELGSGLN